MKGSRVCHPKHPSLAWGLYFEMIVCGNNRHRILILPLQIQMNHWKFCIFEFINIHNDYFPHLDTTQNSGPPSLPYSLWRSSLWTCSFFCLEYTILLLLSSYIFACVTCLPLWGLFSVMIISWWISSPADCIRKPSCIFVPDTVLGPLYMWPRWTNLGTVGLTLITFILHLYKFSLFINKIAMFYAIWLGPFDHSLLEGHFIRHHKSIVGKEVSR